MVTAELGGTGQHRAVRERLASFALGALDADEHVAIQAHLDGCPDCRADLAALRPAAAALSLADPARLAHTPLAPPPEFTARVLSALAAEGAAQRNRDRRRALTRAAGALGAAAAVTALVVTLTLGTRPAGDPVDFAVAPPGVTAMARLEDRAWGTQVHLEVAGLAAGEWHGVWLERSDGTRVPAGSFAGGGPRALRIDLAVSLDRGDAIALGVSTRQGEDLLRAPFGR